MINYGGSQKGNIFNYITKATVLYTKCDWACKNQAYPQKLHMFRKWYFSWSMLKIIMFCKLSLIAYWFMNKSYEFHCYSLCCSKNITSWSSKIRQNFVCRYAVFLQTHLQIIICTMNILCEITNATAQNYRLCKNWPYYKNYIWYHTKLHIVLY